MAEFNPDLHAFLLENETCMWTEKGELKFGVHVEFGDIKEFIKILGYGALDDGGIECGLKRCALNNEYTLYVPLEDYFEYSDLTVNYYKHCFNKDDLERYEEVIKAFDGEGIA